MLKALFLWMALPVLCFTTIARADSLSPRWTETRAKWFAISDKALSGDRAAQQKLEAVYLFYFQDKQSSQLDPAILRKDPYELAPALMNYRYLLYHNKPNTHNMAKSSIELASSQMQEAAYKMSFPPALAMSDREEHIRQAALAGMTVSNIRMAKIYTDMIGGNAPGTDALLVRMAESYLLNALDTKPSDTQLKLIKQRTDELAGKGIAPSTKQAWDDAIMENELRAIQAYADRRKGETMNNISSQCGVKPSLEQNVSSYSRSQMGGFITRLNAYVAWSNCRLERRNEFQRSESLPGSVDILPPLMGQKTSGLGEFMRSREPLKRMYGDNAALTAKIEFLNTLDAELYQNKIVINNAKAGADARYEQLDRDKSSNRPRESGPSRPKTNEPSEAEKFFRNQQSYQRCVTNANAYPAGPARSNAIEYCLRNY